MLLFGMVWKEEKDRQGTDNLDWGQGDMAGTCLGRHASACHAWGACPHYAATGSIPFSPPSPSSGLWLTILPSFPASCYCPSQELQTTSWWWWWWWVGLQEATCSPAICLPPCPFACLLLLPPSYPTFPSLLHTLLPC